MEEQNLKPEIGRLEAGQTTAFKNQEAELQHGAEVNLFQTPIKESEHPHHWKIEEPNGPTSIGRCKHCPAEKIFRNYPWASGDIITNEEHRLGIGDLTGLDL